MFYSTSPLLYLCGFACIAVAVGSFTPIAGYEPRYDVSEHLNLDLDVQDMVNFLGEYEFEGKYIGKYPLHV